MAEVGTYLYQYLDITAYSTAWTSIKGPTVLTRKVKTDVDQCF